MGGGAPEGGWQEVGKEPNKSLDQRKHVALSFEITKNVKFGPI